MFGRASFSSAGPGIPTIDADPGAFLRALGRRVRLLRLARELTQAELAAATGMSRSFLSRIEHGEHGVDIVRLLRLAAALGLPVTDLIDVAGSGT